MSVKTYEAVVNEMGQIELPIGVKLPKNVVVYVVIPETAPLTSNEVFPLKGTVLKYDDPFESAVSITDWDALE